LLGRKEIFAHVQTLIGGQLDFVSGKY